MTAIGVVRENAEALLRNKT